jgi:hypothetical protein
LNITPKISLQQVINDNQSGIKQMANIKVRDLTSIAATDLFDDSESFMRELSDNELEIKGGWRELFERLRFGNIVWD